MGGRQRFTDCERNEVERSIGRLHGRPTKIHILSGADGVDLPLFRRELVGVVSPEQSSGNDSHAKGFARSTHRAYTVVIETAGRSWPACPPVVLGEVRSLS